MKTILDGDIAASLSVPDFQPGRGWGESARAAEGARWACSQLEAGRILCFSSPPFELPEDDRRFLLNHRLSDSRFHKNISYRPSQDLLRGFAAPDPAAAEQLHQFMRGFSQTVTRFLGLLLPPYAPHWSLDYASFRPEAEEGRQLPVRKRNDLLHVDAFPSRPTRGARILRCFININPTQPRIWQTTDGFEVLARKHARAAGLEQIARRGVPPWMSCLHALRRAVGSKTRDPSPYDRFMLRFHDYLKENAEFQRDCPKIRLEFPPGSTWLCFTDAVPHAVLSGQFALEQTFIVPLSAMIAPENSPLRILEALAGRPLVALSHPAPAAAP